MFRRNCRHPDQVRALVAELREAVGRPDAPVLIDQEGGRVARLGPPHWRVRPPAARIGTLARQDEEAAREAAWLAARLIADDLAALGITVDCAPVLDVPQPGAHGIIGDRAFAGDPALVARLGRAACEGFAAGGVLAVIKHVPGHGRAGADSHRELPVVNAPLEALRAVDFVPFRALADAPFAMTAHVLYSALDREAPATTSARVISEIIRGEIGFSGVLLSDDIGMRALRGTPGERAVRALRAGCDVVVHCSGDLDEMRGLADAVPPLAGAAEARVTSALARRTAPEPIARQRCEARLAALLAAA